MSKQKIVAAAQKLFSELGYHRTSMDDIAKEANVAKGTLYYHFPGKSELFKTLVTEGFTMVMNEIRQVLDRQLQADQQIRLIVRKHVDLFMQYGELTHILSNEMTNGIEPGILEQFGELKKQYIEFLSGVMQDAYAEQAIRFVHFELAAAGLFGMIESACLYYNKHRERIALEELHQTIDAFVLSTLLKT